MSHRAALTQANTPGCTKQAQTYRDEHAAWTERGYSVFGLSSDAPKSQRNWAMVSPARAALTQKHDLPYRLLSDPERVLIGALTGVRSSTKRRCVCASALTAATLSWAPTAASPCRPLASSPPKCVSSGADSHRARPLRLKASAHSGHVGSGLPRRPSAISRELSFVLERDA